MPDWDVVESVANVKGHPGDCFSVLASGRKVQRVANRFPESGEHHALALVDEQVDSVLSEVPYNAVLLSPVWSLLDDHAQFSERQLISLHEVTQLLPASEAPAESAAFCLLHEICGCLFMFVHRLINLPAMRGRAMSVVRRVASEYETCVLHRVDDAKGCTEL